MGWGQDVYEKFWGWFSYLTEEQAAAFAKQYPEPEEWRGKYAQIRASPWKQDDE